MVIAGILLPSLLLAWAVRRWVAPVRWSFVALFLALTFGFLHGAVFTSMLPVPVDEVARGYPYRGVVAPVRVASSHIDAPGWTVDGAERVKGTFLEMRLPPGSHDVRVCYRPLSFWLAIPVSLMAAAALTFLKPMEYAYPERR